MKNRPSALPTNAKRNSDTIIRVRSSAGGIVIGCIIGIAVTAKHAEQELGSCRVERGNRIRVFPVGARPRAKEQWACVKWESMRSVVPESTN